MLSEQEYARVYLLDLPYAADRAFDYYIPSSLRSATRRGCFVTVPFGKGNRKQLAVVVSVGDETTLKRYYPEPEKHRIRLHPENRDMKDMYVTECTIQGVAVKVIRDL